MCMKVIAETAVVCEQRDALVAENSALVAENSALDAENSARIAENTAVKVENLKSLLFSLFIKLSMSV
jgi:hypothetical protein